MSLGILDELGILAGTDKGMLGHDYLRHYEGVFRRLRDESFTLLEIGVAAGSSLRMWAEYFQRATIVGVDINDAARQFAGGRCIVEIGSQADPAFLTSLSARYSPMIIVDDGSHQADHIVMTFQQLYPSLLPGGLYVVEDVQFHAGPWAFEHRGAATVTPQEYFLTLAHLTVCPNDTQIRFEERLASATDAVEFFHGGVIVKKRPTPPADRLTRCVELVKRANQAHLWSDLAGYVLNCGGDPTEAVAYARRAIELGSHSLGIHQMLSLVLERTGDLAGAIDAQREAVRLHPTVAPFAARLSDLESRQ